MEEMVSKIKSIVNDKIRPRTRVDGGDILFKSFEEGIVHIDAFADCATCQCCEGELSFWITKQIKKELHIDVSVKITRNKPYFA